MRWVCPHCQASLQTPNLGPGAQVPGPQPGTAYARCAKCREFAVVELASGNAIKIANDKDPNEAPHIVAPPPFVHGDAMRAAIARPAAAPIAAPPADPATPAKPASPANATLVTPTAARANDPFERFLQASTQVEGGGAATAMKAPFPAPLADLDTPDGTYLETEPFEDSASGRLKKIVIIGGVGASLIVAAGFASDLIGRMRLATETPSTTQTQSQPHSQGSGPTQLERAQAAAKRVEGQARKPAPAPAATSASIPAAPPSSASTAIPAPAPATLAAQAPTIDDTIRSSAMAPRRTKPEDIQLYLQATRQTRSMDLRTGPGAEYPLFGLGDLAERYPVVEWKGRWFRIQLEETPGLTAWVSHEKVELFSKDMEPGMDGSLENDSLEELRR